MSVYRKLYDDDCDFYHGDMEDAVDTDLIENIFSLVERPGLRGVRVAIDWTIEDAISRT